jgi:ABC-2 type transport system permease protein
MSTMTQFTYLRYEFIRTYRNRRFLLFSLGFPLILFLAVAGPHKNQVILGISFPLYYMTGMVAWGTMVAVISSGARIAAERQVGWTRQLRITPLPTSSYFAAKIFTGYVMALLSIIVIFVAGSLYGVHLTVSQYLVVVGLLLVGLIPFSVLGIMFGHLLTTDSLGPAIGGTTSLMALLGGAYGPLATGGAFLAVVKCLPSYWLVIAGKTAIDGGGWPLEGWIVIAVWTVVTSALAVRAYQRDTKKI